MVANSWRRFNRLRRQSRIDLSFQISQLTSNCLITPFVENIEPGREIGFDVLITCSKQHARFLEMNIQNLTRLYGEKTKIQVIHAKDLNLGSLRGIRNENISFLSEDLILGKLERRIPAITRYNPDRQNWLRQQLIKTFYVHKSKKPILIIDVDTFLCRAINFLANRKSLLLVGSKNHSHYHVPYSEHIAKFLGTTTLPFNFVHHVQIQVPERVREIYSDDIESGLNKWLALGSKFREFSAVSEFQTYGEFMLMNHPEEIALFDHNHHLEKLSNCIEKKKELQYVRENIELKLKQFQVTESHLVTFL